MAGRVLFGATIFVSAFLLFQVQPVIGKTILPWFGSSPGVWTTCLLFFQVLLLGGYAYAHFLVSRLTPRRQALLHGLLLLAALATLPITPAADWKPTGEEAPVGRILLVLTFSVGLPYLLLSATGPLLQGWFAGLNPGRSPYRLYALSNLGSLLALLTYPLWVERLLRLREQTAAWSLLYVLFALLCGACAWQLLRKGAGRGARRDVALSQQDDPSHDAAAALPGRGYGFADVLQWFLLAACASALLMATTNQLCLDVAVVPFLWVVPLAIYLLSFILTFDHARWYVRPLFCALLSLSLIHVVGLLQEGVDAELRQQVLWLSIALFAGCMCCHGELARLKPAPRHLTFFFLVVSMGGAAGGLAVALGAPHWFDDFHEYPLLLVAVFALVLLVVLRQAWRLAPAGEPARRGMHLLSSVLWIASLGVILYGAVQAFEESTWAASGDSLKEVEALQAWLRTMHVWAVAVPLVFLVLLEGGRWLRGAGLAAWWGAPRRLAVVAGGSIGCLGAVALVTAVGWQLQEPGARHVARGRNFYGVLAIKEYYPAQDWHDYTLKHGRIMHGFQYRRRPGWPTSYYGPKSGVGLAVQLHPQRWAAGRSFRIGVVGLGTGTMAAYANAEVDASAWDDDRYVISRVRTPGDVVRFYEINPMVREWAWQHFSYLGDARARGADVDVTLGDARLVMERQLARGEPQQLDVLAIDAFSSDAIPIHLLTRESLEIYFRHLAPDGVLAVHVTNRFIDLVPIVHTLANVLGKEIVHVDSPDEDARGVDSCDWLLLSSNIALLDAVRLEGHAVEVSPPGPLWTDDYSSVWGQLKIDDD